MANMLWYRDAAIDGDYRWYAAMDDEGGPTRRGHQHPHPDARGMALAVGWDFLG